MPTLFETYQQRKGGTVAPTSSGGTLYNNYLQRKESLKDFKMPEPKKVSQQEIKVSQPAKQDFGEGVKKFAARSVVGFGDLISESLDFAAGFIIDNPIYRPVEKLQTKITEVVRGKEKAKELGAERNKWKDAYKKAAKIPKLGWDMVQNTDYIKPSKEWSEASLEDKLTKRLGETLAVLGPNIAPSFALYALNPALGLATTVGSTANDVKEGAIENGVSEDKATYLGLGTGILVGALDRIVPDDLFSGKQKAQFIKGFVRRIVPMSLKEAGTEIAQENIQIAAEATFRKDLGWDEVSTRNAMAGLGGLLGGAGATTVVGTVNAALSQDILGAEVETPAPVIQEGVKAKPEPKVKVQKEKPVVEVTQEATTPVSEKEPFTVPKEVEKEIKTVTREQVKTIKDIKEVKSSLKNIVSEYEYLITEMEGRAALAQEAREGLNTKDITTLKRVYAINKKFREGDIETIRASKSKDLVNRVVENVQEKFPEMSEQEAFDYALSLPTKAEEKVRQTPDVKNIKQKGKALTNYLHLLSQKQRELAVKQDDVLFRAWQSALAAQEKLRRVVEVPRQQLPVGEGKERVSRLEARVKGVLDNVSEADIERLGLSTYRQMSKKENISRAADYVTKNPDEALRVLEGKADAPEGLLRNSIYVVMENMAKDDIELARKLASLSATRMGQELSILAELDPESPVKLMREVIEIREETFKKRYKGKSVKEAKAEIVQDIRKTMQAPNKSDWNSFLNSIQC